MNTSQQVKILSKISKKDETGKHFTQIYNIDDLIELEKEGLLVIEKPVHDTGIPYSSEYWGIEVTEDGIALVEANPEYYE